jgi:threonine dehydrogenase-like Zn-dependent dehydrogenase
MDRLNGIMKAFGIHQYNTPLVALDLPLPPPPGSRQIAVRVITTTINPVDMLISQGYGSGLLNRRKRFPQMLGRDGVGVVTAVGAGVKGFSVGQRVMFAISPRTGGAYAEYIVVGENCAQPLPEQISDELGAAISYAGATALQALKAAGLTPQNAAGRTVCINGASGGLGSVAVLAASSWGAKVIAVCSSKNHEWVLRLGASQAIDYRDAAAMSSIKANVIFNAAPPVEDKHVFRDPLSSCLEPQLGHKPSYVTVISPILGLVSIVGVLPGLLLSGVDFARRQVSFTFEGRRYRWVLFHESASTLSELAQLFAKYPTAQIVRRCEPISELPALFNGNEVAKGPGKLVFRWGQ